MAEKKPDPEEGRERVYLAADTCPDCGWWYCQCPRAYKTAPPAPTTDELEDLL